MPAWGNEGIWNGDAFEKGTKDVSGGVSWECPSKIQLTQEPLRNVLCEPKPKLNQEINMMIHDNKFVDLTHKQDPFVESGIISNSEMPGLTKDNKVMHTINIVFI